MSKLYRVIDNGGVQQYNIKVGDYCTLLNFDEGGSAWFKFKSDSWSYGGVYWLWLDMVEEVQ